nr:unnamed protein product [Triticum aestivum]
MLAVAAAKEHGEACSARKCGNTTISHPFWLPVWDTGRSCGSPEFEVSCRDNGTTPILLNSGAISLGFVIINIFYEEHSLHVVDRGKLELLHASSSCGLPMWNTSVKLGPRSWFRIAPVNMNLILYNCTKAAGAAALAQDRELVQTRMRCGDESEVFARAGGRYYETTDYGGGHEGCDAAVMPVLGTWAGEVNASDYERLISDGFLLTWQSPPTGNFTRQIKSSFHQRSWQTRTGRAFAWISLIRPSYQSWHSLIEDKAIDPKSSLVMANQR